MSASISRNDILRAYPRAAADPDLMTAAVLDTAFDAVLHQLHRHSRMLPNTPASDRVERFLDAHPTGLLVVCVGSASVAGIVWLAQRCARQLRRRPSPPLLGGGFLYICAMICA